MAKKKNSKTKAKTSKLNTTSLTTSDNITTEVINATLGAANQAIFLKVCRLCETRDGPFLNIFDSEKVTAKKIEELMPFWVAENDDLPHKICFRCSAKLEELYEFVQKCIGTQENLRRTIGKSDPLPVKSKTRHLWEHKLNKSNMSNDDICDALIKKAMESIQDKIPQLFPLDENESIHKSTSSLNAVELKQNSSTKVAESISDDIDDNVALKHIKLSRDDRDNIAGSQLGSVEILQQQYEQENTLASEQYRMTSSSKQSDSSKPLNKDVKINKHKEIDTSNDNTMGTRNNVDRAKTISESTVNSKPFDVMDHVTMIKVHGVGVLFQCKICNRNFLKKSVVQSHACAKSGVPKVDISKTYTPPETPKVTTVKYINTRLGNDNKDVTVRDNQQTLEKVNGGQSAVTQFAKKKIGPASKIGRRSERSNLTSDVHQTPDEAPDKSLNITQQTSDTQVPAVKFPGLPSLDSRYKLVPGPNNTFTLVEDKKSNNHSESNSLEGKCVTPEIIDLALSTVDNKPAKLSRNSKRNKSAIRTSARNAGDLDKERRGGEQREEQQPYPVGLFQTMSHHSTTFNHSTSSEQVPFTTPAMRKQSYTVVQTGDPSKLLISTKPQQAAEEVPKKRIRRAKANGGANSKKDFSIVLEDISHPKDHGFFTFINVDPLLQPSYVLPTDNTIQESQITTSTNIANKELDTVDKEAERNKYRCNMCGEKFNREKKLNSHIYSHYKVDSKGE